MKTTKQYVSAVSFSILIIPIEHNVYGKRE